jgi:hypothetical protein
MIMRRMCAVLAVAGALSGIAPVTAVASGGSSTSRCVITGLLIPLC